MTSIYAQAITELRGSLERDELDDAARDAIHAEINTLLDMEAKQAESDAIEQAAAEAARFDAEDRAEREARIADSLDQYHY